MDDVSIYNRFFEAGTVLTSVRQPVRHSVLGDLRGTIPSVNKLKPKVKQCFNNHTNSFPIIESHYWQRTNRYFQSGGYCSRKYFSADRLIQKLCE